MTLPGTTVISRESPPASSASADTGTLFVAGLSERGPTDEAVLVRNLAQYVSTFGPRVSYGSLYDALDVFFREGGSRAYVGRVVGPTPVVATVNLQDSTPANTLRVDALSAGEWGNDLDVAVVAGDVGGTFKIRVKDDGEVVETSPDLADNDAAVAWAANSDYIRITDLGGNDPAVVGDTSLATGADDRTNVTDAEWVDALNLFTKELGPGQVAAPGRTTLQGHSDLLDHAQSHNRFALLDITDSGDAPTLEAASGSVRALDTARYGAIFAPWAVVPGIAAGTSRTVPYSAVQAGLIARLEGRGRTPNEAAAGDNGVSVYATGLSQSQWTDADRESLNDAGVNVARFFNGAVRTYGYRTPVDPLADSAWLEATNARLAMAISAAADAIAERFLFRQLDGQRRLIAEFGGELSAMLLPLWSAGALYGDSPADAFNVDVGSQVNTEESIAARELRAVIAVRMSPFAEVVVIEVVKVANTEAIPS